MTYVLGSATNTSAPARLQNTVSPDGFASLAAAYGITAQQIIDLQKPLGLNAPINNASVQAFVKSRPGWNAAEGLFPFSASSNPGTRDVNGNPEGFAHFTNATQLMLPDMPRLDGKTPTTKVTGGLPTVKDASIGGGALGGVVAFLGAAALGWMLLAEHKDRKKRTAKTA